MSKLKSTSYAGIMLARMIKSAEFDGEQFFLFPKTFIERNYRHEWRKRTLDTIYYLAKHGYIDYDGLDGSIIITDLETAKRVAEENGIMTAALQKDIAEALKIEEKIEAGEPEEEPAESEEEPQPEPGWEQQFPEVQDAIRKCQEAIENVHKVLASLKF